MKKYLVVVENSSTGYSAYSPDLPGCVSTGSTREEVERNMREAIAFHLEGLREDGEPVPEPQAYSAYVDVADSSGILDSSQGTCRIQCPSRWIN